MADPYEILAAAWKVPRPTAKSRVLGAGYALNGDPTADFTPEQIEIVKAAIQRQIAEDKINAKLS
jgi:hypothetical protein